MLAGTAPLWAFLNVGGPELWVIAIVALLVLGPKRLPELARGLGKAWREFRKQTDGVRSAVEREFYLMDQEVRAPLIAPASGAQASTSPQSEAAALPPESTPEPVPEPVETEVVHTAPKPALRSEVGPENTPAKDDV